MDFEILALIFVKMLPEIFAPEVKEEKIGCKVSQFNICLYRNFP
jgi:hypothetical protein